MSANRLPASPPTGRRRLRAGLIRSSAFVTAGLFINAPVVAQTLPTPANVVSTDQSGGAAPVISNPGLKLLQVDLKADSTIINWSEFSIPAGNTATFSDATGGPVTAMAVLNRVTGSNASQILGSLNSDSNVSVFLLNPNGVLFGAASTVSVGALVAGTRDLADADFLDGSTFNFTGAGAGEVTVASGAQLTAGGSSLTSQGLVLIGAKIASQGKLTAVGDVGLVAAENVTLTLAPGSPLSIAIDAGSSLATPMAVSGTVGGRNVLFAAATRSTVTDTLLDIRATVTATTASATDRGIILAAGPSGGGDRVTFAGKADNSGKLGVQLRGTLTATGGANGGVTVGSGTAIGPEASSATAVINATGAVRVQAGTGDIKIGAVASSSGGVDLLAGTGGSLTVDDVSAGTGALALSATDGAITAGNLSADGVLTAAAGTGLQTGKASGASVSLTTTAGALGSGAITASTGGVTVSGKSDVAIGAVTGGAGAMSLTSTSGKLSAGDVKSGSGGVTISATKLTLGDVNAGTGAIDLTAASGDIEAGDLTSTGAEITLSAASGTMTLGAVSGKNHVTATSKSVQATSLGSTDGKVQASATAGDLTIGSINADGAASVSASGALRANSISGGTLTLSGTSLQGVAPGGRTDLSSGDEIQFSPSGDLLLGSVQAAKDITLSGSTVDITTLAASGGAVSVTSTSGDLAIGSVTDGNTVSLTAADKLSGGAITSDGTIGLEAKSIDLGALNGTALTLKASTGNAQFDGGSITSGTLTVAGDLVLDALLTGSAGITANVTGDLTGSGISTTGSASLTIGGKVDAGKLVGGTGLTVSADAVTLTSAGNSSGVASLTATTGALTLGSGSFAAAELTGVGIVLNGLVNASGNATLTSSASIKTAAVSSDGTLKIAAATGLTAGNLTGDGGLDLAAASIDAGALSGGTLSLSATAGDARFDGGSVASGTIEATGDVILDALLTGTGNLTLKAGGDLLGTGVSTTGSLDAEVTDAIDAGQLGGAAGLGVKAASITLDLASASAGAVSLDAGAGAVDVGAVTAKSDATLKATGNATVSGNATVGGTYSVSAAAVTLGGDPGAVQQSDGAVTISSSVGDITGLAGLTLRSNADGAGAEALTLSSAAALDFAPTTLLAGGPARQSLVSLSWLSGKALVLGGISAQGIDGGVLSNSAAITLGGNVSLTNALKLDSSGGAISVAGVDVLGAGADLTLATGAGQAINASGALSATGALTITAAGGLTAQDLNGASISATASGGGLSAGDVAATGRVELKAPSGSVIADSVTAGSSTLALQRDASLTGQSVEIGTVGIGTDLLVKATSGQLSVGKGLAGNLVTLIKEGAAGDLLVSGVLEGGGNAGSAGTVTVSSTTDARLATLRSLTGDVTVSATGAIGGVLAGSGAVLESQAAAGDLSVIAGGALTLAGFDAGRDITLSSGAALGLDGALSISGNLQATGVAVNLGSGAKQAGGLVQIISTGGGISGDPSGSILSDSDGLGGGDLILRSAGQIALTGYDLSAGPARQSAVRILAAPGTSIAIGNVSARALVSWDALLSQVSVEHNGALGLADVSVVDDLLIGSGGVVAPSLQIGNAQSAGDIVLRAAALNGAGGATPALTALTGAVTVDMTGSVALASLTARDGAIIRSTGGSGSIAIGTLVSSAGGFTVDAANSAPSGASGISIDSVQAAGAVAVTTTGTRGDVAIGTLVNNTGDLTIASVGAVRLGTAETKTGAIRVDGTAVTGLGGGTGPLDAGFGRASLTAGGLIDLGASGILQLGAIKASGALVLGGSAIDALSLNAGNVKIDATTTLAAGSVTATAGGAVIGAGNAVDLGTLLATGTVSVTSGVSFDFDTIESSASSVSLKAPGAVRGNLVRAFTTADVDAGTIDITDIDANGLTTLRSAGSLDLGSVDTKGGISVIAGADIDFIAIDSQGGIALDAVGAVAGKSLSASGAVDLSGATIEVATISGASLDTASTGLLKIDAAKASGAIKLESGAAAELGTIDAGAALSVTTAGTLAFGSLTGTVVTLDSGGGIAGTDVTATGETKLRGTSIDIGSVSASTLGSESIGATRFATVTTGGSATITSGGAASLGNVKAATLSASAGGDLDFGSISGGAATLKAAQTLSGGKIVSSGAGVLTAGGTLTVADISAGTTLVIEAGTDLSAGTITAGGAVTLGSGRDLKASGINAASLLATASGKVDLGNISVTKTVDIDSAALGFVALQAGGEVKAKATGALVGGSVKADTATLTGATIALDALTTGGSASLTTTSAMTLGTVVAGGALKADAGEALTLQDATGSGAIDLRSGTTAKLGAIKAQAALSVDAVGDVAFGSLEGATVALAGKAGLSGSKIASSGAGVLTAGGALTVADVSAGTTLMIEAGNDLSAGTITAGGAVTLGSGRDLKASGINAASLLATASGKVDLSNISVTRTVNIDSAALGFVALEAGSEVKAKAAGALAGGSVKADTATLTGATIALDALTTGGSASLTTTSAMTLGTVVAGGVLKADALDALTLQDATGSGAIDLRSGTTAKLGAVKAQAALSVDAVGDVAFGSLEGATVALAGKAGLSGSKIASSGALTITAAGAAKLDTIAGGGVTLTVGSLDAGTVTASGALGVTSGSAVTIGQLSAGAGLNLKGGQTKLGDGAITGDATLDATGAIDLGALTSTGALTIDGDATLAFKALKAGGAAKLTTVGTVDGGAIDASGLVLVESQQSIELDEVVSGGALTLRVGGASVGTLAADAVSPAAAPAGEIVLGSARSTAAATLAAPGRVAITGSLTIGDDLTVTGASVALGGNGAATQRATGTIAITASTGSITGASGLAIDAGRALSLTARGAGAGIDLAADTRVTVATDLVLDTAGTLRLGSVTGGSGPLTLSASDLALQGTLSGTDIRIVNRGNGLIQVGETPQGNAAEFDGATPGLRLGSAELGRITATTLTLDAGQGGFLFGDTTVAAATGSQRLAWRTTGRIDMLGRFVADGGSAAREIIFGGDGADGLAQAIRIAARPEGGGRIDAPGALLTLEASRVGVGYDRDLLNQIGLAPGSSRNPTPREIAATLVSRSSSSLYIATLSGETVYRDPTLIRAGALNVRYAQFALFQNTGLPGLTSGVELAGIAGRATLNLSARETPDGNAFAFFGSINGVSGKATSLLGNEGISLDIPVDRGSSRANGCLIGSAGGGCLVASLAQPQLLLVENNTEIFGSSNLLTVPFDPLVGSNNESLFADIAGFDIPVEPAACPSGETSCKVEPQP